ncbi:MAG: hypothetical protein ACREMA_16035 [Longimicrobiales bacterium]
MWQTVLATLLGVTVGVLLGRFVSVWRSWPAVAGAMLLAAAAALWVMRG